MNKQRYLVDDLEFASYLLGRLKKKGVKAWLEKDTESYYLTLVLNENHISLTKYCEGYLDALKDMGC